MKQIRIIFICLLTYIYPPKLSNASFESNHPIYFLTNCGYKDIKVIGTAYDVCGSMMPINFKFMAKNEYKIEIRGSLCCDKKLGYCGVVLK